MVYHYPSLEKHPEGRVFRTEQSAYKAAALHGVDYKHIQKYVRKYDHENGPEYIWLIPEEHMPVGKAGRSRRSDDVVTSEDVVRKTFGKDFVLSKFVRHMIHNGLADREIWKVLRDQFGYDHTKEYFPRWYRHKLNKTWAINKAQAKIAGTYQEPKPKPKELKMTEEAKAVKPTSEYGRVGTAAEMFRRLIMEGTLPDSEIFAQVQAEFNLSDDCARHVAWYRFDLRRKGFNPPPKVEDPAKAQAKAEREAAKAQAKAEREAAKAQIQAEREAAKAQAQAEREAAKAQAKAEREAAKAAAAEAKAQAKAEREAAKAAAAEAKAQAKAEREAAKAAAQNGQG